MTNDWFNFVLRTKTKPESVCHTHVPSDEADRFHSWDGCSTEMEYLSLIHALLLVLKPKCVLETGTARGLGTMAIASALKFNGGGKVWTIDKGDTPAAQKLIASRGLSGHVEFVKSHSIAFLAGCEISFEFAFFDSGHGMRRREYMLASQRGCLAPGALCVFHDTSLARINAPTDEGFLAWLSSLPRIEFRKSRGLTMFQHDPGSAR